MAIVENLSSLGGFAGVLLLALLCPGARTKRRLPLAGLTAPLTRGITCRAKWRRVILNCDGANSAGVATGRLRGLATGATLLRLMLSFHLHR